MRAHFLWWQQKALNMAHFSDSFCRNWKRRLQAKDGRLSGHTTPNTKTWIQKRHMNFHLELMTISHRSFPSYQFEAKRFISNALPMDGMLFPLFTSQKFVPFCYRVIQILIQSNTLYFVILQLFIIVRVRKIEKIFQFFLT